MIIEDVRMAAGWGTEGPTMRRYARNSEQDDEPDRGVNQPSGPEPPEPPKRGCWPRSDHGQLGRHEESAKGRDQEG